MHGWYGYFHNEGSHLPWESIATCLNILTSCSFSSINSVLVALGTMLHIQALVSYNGYICTKIKFPEYIDLQKCTSPFEFFFIAILYLCMDDKHQELCNEIDIRRLLNLLLCIFYYHEFQIYYLIM